MIIDGKKIAHEVTQEIKSTIIDRGLKPKLGIILIGDNPASQVYVNQKLKKGKEIGVLVDVFRFPESAKQKEIEETINKLNSDKSFSGIIIQLPLPEGFDKDFLLGLINSRKDVDGLQKDSFFKPATPLGILELLKRNSIVIRNKFVVVMGASDLVGKPVAKLLEEAGGLVEIVDIDTSDPNQIIKKADILVVAIGNPLYVKKEMVKEGVVVIDVGINQSANGLVGDVDFTSVEKIASYITPVPGGVGPMTVAMLLSNVVLACERQLSNH